jgi:hypothetical protein
LGRASSIDTIGQVKEIGLFAWREDDCLFADGCLLRVNHRSNSQIQGDAEFAQRVRHGAL